jgi:hypothetical protein
MKHIKLNKKEKLRGLFLTACVFILFSFLVSSASARDLLREEKDSGPVKSFKPSALLPNTQQRVHRVGLLTLCVTNWGYFGSQSRRNNESVGGCFNPNPDKEVPAPSCEYPPGSNIDYLFQGGLWIGAKVDDKPYVSLGCDGWFGVYELWPEGPAPKGAIQERSTRPSASCYSPDAISEQDIIAVYSDTWADIPEQDPFDLRKHFPLNVQITQKSYSWSYEYAEDFVLIDYTVKNIGFKKLKDMYMGLYIDADCLHQDENPYGPYGAQDDICGFKHLVTSPKGEYYDTVNLAWISDNDGHGDEDGGEKATVFTNKSPIAVTGTRVVRSPKPGLKYSFNWFISNQGGSPRDWGPWKTDNQKIWAKMNPYGSGNNFPDNVLGTPGGDVSKYFIMSNGEFDYDQIYSCVWPNLHPDEGWLPVNTQMCGDLANGFDTRYLLSFGPFDEIGPGESLLITIGYIAGDNFHVNPTNLAKDPNMTDPDRFYANLDFSDFETNATWAAKVYDNPTPEHPSGDGTPDFKGPPPPPPPVLSFQTERGKVKIKWNGKASERTRDSFNGRVDFEGYRIYMSRTGRSDDYALLGSFDKIDYKIYKLNRVMADRPWEWRVASASWDSLKSWLNGKGIGRIDSVEDTPTFWNKANPFVIRADQDPFFIRLSDSLDQAGVPVVYDSIPLGPLDSLYFEAQDWNMGFDTTIVVNPAYRDSVDSGWVDSIEDRYYDYKYTIEVFPGQPSYFAVTTFDVGDPPTKLQSLEASKLVNATLVYPVDNPEVVKKEGLKVVVYPNPYRIDGNYYPEYETKKGNLDKRLNFINLPPQCTIRIYTLDGDLVKTLEHDKQEGDLDATYHYWDLVSRNSQAVVSGIYLFCVKDRETGETQIGKFVIIK